MATLLVPPAPVQVNEYELGIVSAPVLCVPLVALLPLQPPEAVHEVALVELHVSVEAPPLAIEVGFAVNVTVGAGTTVTVAVATLLVPPVPLQVKEYEVVAVSCAGALTAAGGFACRSSHRRRCTRWRWSNSTSAWRHRRWPPRLDSPST